MPQRNEGKCTVPKSLCIPSDSFTDAWLSFSIAESRNRGINEIGKDLKRSSGPTSLSKQGHLGPVAQDCVQATSEYPQRRRLYNLSGKPVQELRHPHSQKVLPEVQREPPGFRCVPIVSGPATGHHWKEPVSVLFSPSPQVFMYINKTLSDCSAHHKKHISWPFLVLEMLYSLTQFCDFGWAFSIISTPFLCLGAHYWTLYSKYGLTSAA